jgi:hypothetical protein
MQIVFFSNFLNHHQAPVCEELYKLSNHNFFFVACEPMPLVFLDKGYRDYSDACYLVQAFKNQESYNRALKLASEADVAIFGSAPMIFEIERLKLNKLTFEYEERVFKRGLINIMSPRLLKKQFYYHFIFPHENLYKLAASAYLANDMRVLHSFKDKCFKWDILLKLVV